MAWQNDLSIQVLSSSNRRVEVVEFKPQEHAVSVRCNGGIAYMAMMMIHIPSVQLKNQFAVRKNGKVHLRGVSYHGPTIANFLRGRNMEQTVRSTRVARMSPQRARDRIVREVAGERGPDDRRWSCLRPVT